MGLNLGFGLGPLRASIPLRVPGYRTAKGLVRSAASGGGRRRPSSPARPTGPSKAQLREQAIRDVVAWFAILPVPRMGGDLATDEINGPLARGEVGAAAQAFVRRIVRLTGDLPETYVGISLLVAEKRVVTEAFARPPQAGGNP